MLFRLNHFISNSGWIGEIKRDPKKDFTLSSSKKVCSAHFKEEVFANPSSKTRRLKPNVCPSVFDWTKEAPHRLLPNKRARIQEDQERLTREETETASGGEGDYEEGQGGVTSRAIQVDVELICNHRFSVAILRSFCTADTKEKKHFMLYTGFKSYSQFQEILEFVLPGL